MEISQSQFEGWALLEVMGHQRFAGYVKTEAFGGTVLFRVDVPELPERERKNEYDRHTPTGRRIPSGAMLTEQAVQPFTKLFGACAVYSLTPCTEEVARALAEQIAGPRPFSCVRMPDGAMAPPSLFSLVEPEDDPES